MDREAAVSVITSFNENPRASTSFKRREYEIERYAGEKEYKEIKFEYCVCM